MKRKPKAPIEHGIGSAVYALQPPGVYRPSMACLCGETFTEMSWEEAGEGLDSHLRETTSKEGGTHE